MVSHVPTSQLFSIQTYWEVACMYSHNILYNTCSSKWYPTFQLIDHSPYKTNREKSCMYSHKLINHSLHKHTHIPWQVLQRQYCWNSSHGLLYAIDSQTSGHNRESSNNRHICIYICMYIDTWGRKSPLSHIKQWCMNILFYLTTNTRVALNDFLNKLCPYTLHSRWLPFKRS